MGEQKLDVQILLYKLLLARARRVEQMRSDQRVALSSTDWVDYSTKKPVRNAITYEPLKYTVQNNEGNPSYMAKWTADRRDFTKLAPGKKVEVHTLPHGLYGYTFLHRNEMVISSRVVEPFKYEVDVHESIHTPDEYETRVIAWWMLQEHSDDPYLLEQKPFKLNY